MPDHSFATEPFLDALVRLSSATIEQLRDEADSRDDIDRVHVSPCSMFFSDPDATTVWSDGITLVLLADDRPPIRQLQAMLRQVERHCTAGQAR